jgi:exopolysaccharide biosynthesis polyprenyl glycosylphosphotransferase
LRFFSKINISIIGINKAVHELLQNMDKFSYMSYEIPFVFDDNYPNDHYENIPVIKDENMYMQMIKDSNIKVVVLAYEKNVSRFLKEMLFDLMRRNIFFLDISDFFEIFLRRIPLDAVNEVWFLKNIDLSIKKIYRYGKRLVDCVMAVFLLLITLPFLPFTMLFIKLESPGPVFFLQKRVGYLGKIFTLIKFRTMCIKNNDFEPTSQNDSRIKSFGKLLRKTRIDEIPQIINVLKGEMSFIGPRPERPELVKELEQVVPFYRQRLLVKPGVSGWDQVSGEYHSPSKEDTYKKLQYDLYYIKNMSLFLDISIFFKTMSIVFNRKGI